MMGGNWFRMRMAVKKVRKKVWRIWAKSLGEKVGETATQADTIAMIRTVWWLTHMATCIAVLRNAIANHGWGLFG